MTLPLTERQEQLWRYIKSCDISPTFAEMAAALGTSSKGRVHRLLGDLEKRGFIERARNHTRAIIAVEPPFMERARQLAPEALRRPVDTIVDVIYIPLRGRIS